MMPPELPPLASDLRELLELATTGPGPSSATCARLKTRIDRSIAIGGGGSGGGIVMHARAVFGVGAAAVVAATIWIASHGAVHSEPPRTAKAAVVSPAPVSIGAPPPPPVVTREAILPVAPVVAAQPRKRRAVAPVREVVQPPPPLEDAEVPAPSPRDTTAVRERELIEQARRALATRSAGRAIALLDEHAAELPDGDLAEEREALMIQALAIVRNPLAASARARAFRTTYPNSIFRDVVDAAAPATPSPSLQESP